MKKCLFWDEQSPFDFFKFLFRIFIFNINNNTYNNEKSSLAMVTLPLSIFISDVIP